jgi:hypothetical protein
MNRIAILLVFIITTLTCCHRRQAEVMAKPSIPQADSSLAYHARYLHTNLSQQFDIEVNFNTYEFGDGEAVFVAEIYVIDKRNKQCDSIHITSENYYATYFRSDTQVLSYTTGYNAEREVLDNNFGDIVIADLNFDGLDDIAVINDYGGNAGPLYNYYVQQANLKFELDTFLTQQVGWFPTEIDTVNHALTTYVHASAMSYGKHVYAINSNTWSTKLDTIISFE